MAGDNAHQRCWESSFPSHKTGPVGVPLRIDHVAVALGDDSPRRLVLDRSLDGLASVPGGLTNAGAGHGRGSSHEEQTSQEGAAHGA